jgi:hypothetical protein
MQGLFIPTTGACFDAPRNSQLLFFLVFCMARLKRKVPADASRCQ